MRDLTELNINEGGEPVRRPAPTDATIQAFQSRYGVTLPAGLLRLLQHSNGGHPEKDTIHPTGGKAGSEWAVNCFYHLSDDRHAEYSIWEAMETWRPILGNAALPLAEDGGGDLFFLDLKQSPPAVKVCVHDDGFAIVDLAPSFEEFIDALHVDPNMI